VLPNFAEIIRRVSTPFRLNSFLHINEESDGKAFYRSHVTETSSGRLKFSEEKPCFISLSECDFSKQLGAFAFKADNDQWHPGQFAEFAYDKIGQLELLRDYDDHVVLGHVTSEQSIIDMCLEGEGGKELVQGMSVLASHKMRIRVVMACTSF